MAVTASAQRRILGPARPVVLHGYTRSVVQGVREPVIAGLPPDSDAALAGPLGDGRDACQTAQRGVVTSLQGIEGFCEQRGEDDPSRSRQGCEDLRVMLLHLPRLALLGGGKLGRQLIEPAMGVFDLPVEQPDTRDQGLDVCLRRLRGPLGNAH